MTDSKKIDDGGLAFPTVKSSLKREHSREPHRFTEDYQTEGGMSLRDWFATHAPEPSDDEIKMQFSLDASRNPHNDYHKPARRSKLQIVAEYKFAYADAMIAARKAGG